MSLKYFRAEPHVISGQHIREYPHATRASQEQPLKLAIKHYVPLHIPKHEVQTERAVTIVAAHANGFPKEMYEPLWDDLWEFSFSRNFIIRGIWFADSSHQGESGVLNEQTQGDDPSYFDHARDLLLMINHFREWMPRPLVGFAHSMGCAQIVQLSLIHPRLLSSLILIEPVIQSGIATPFNPALPATMRQDLWSSRYEAEQSFRSAKLFKKWDKRVLDSFVRNAFRPVPTALYADDTTPSGAVTLKTTKHQEAWSYVRPLFEPVQQPEMERLIAPDVDTSQEGSYLFSRPECLITLRNLPFVRPPVLYMFGAKSPMSPKAWIEEKMALTGSGVGGSGGHKAGCVQKILFEQAGHFLPCEETKEVCKFASNWLETQMDAWFKEDEFHRKAGSAKSTRNMLAVSDLWREKVRAPADTQRDQAAKL